MITMRRQGFGIFTAQRGIGPCVWPHFDLLAIHRGEVAITVLGGRECRLAAHQAVLIYPQTPFVGRALGGSARASAHHFALSPDVDPALPGVLRRLHGLTRGFQLLRSGWTRDVGRDLARAIALGGPQPDQDTTDQQVALLSLVLSSLGPESASAGAGRAPPAALERLVDGLRQRLDRPPSLADMARQAGCSPNRFIEHFRRHYAATPGRFLLGMRMLEAQRQLAETTRPIGSIAHAVGYSDVPHFYRAFVASSHMTPRAYRQLHGVAG